MESKSFTPGIVNIDDFSMDGTSPMSDLTRNLSSLSTNIPLLSWESPLTNSYQLITADDSPFGIDSPTFQEGVLRDLQPNARQRRCDKSYAHRKLITKNLCAQDKENNFDSPRKSSKPIFKRKLNSENSESDFSGSSQESGYCEAEFTKQTSFHLAPDRIPSMQCSNFTDEEVEDEEGFFSLDKFEDDSMSTSMSQLLTNPLRGPADECYKSICQKPSSFIRKVKPAMRRCLSVATSNFDTPSRNTNLIDIEMASPSVEYEHSISPEKVSFKRPEQVNSFTPLQIKRRKSSPNVDIPSASRPTLQRCYSETAATIMNAVERSDQNPDFIGDFTRPYALPLIDGRHQDLKTIKCDTLVKLIEGEFCDVKNFRIIDCRYTYEYEGGHIKGSTNIYLEKDLDDSLLVRATLPQSEHRSLIIFHCEFSSERAPRLMRYLRNRDRELNQESYPRLYHPEIYLLEGGYKSFFEEYKEFCEPRSYKPMMHKDHTVELGEFRAKTKSRDFRAKSKSFGNDTSRRQRLRSNLNF